MARLAVACALAFVLVGLCFVKVQSDDSDEFDGFCQSDNQCDYDECCVKDPRRNGAGRCRDIGDDPGDRCGGPYFCQGCRKGLECVQNQRGDGYSSGICQWPQNFAQNYKK